MARSIGLPPVHLTPDDVPEPVRAAVDAYYAVRNEATALGNELDRLSIADPERREIGAKHEAKLDELVAAHNNLSNLTLAHRLAMRDYAEVQRVAHFTKARELLQQAEKELMAAAQSARLVAMAEARAGQPVISIEGGAGDRSEKRTGAMNCVSAVRRALDVLAARIG